MPFAKGTLWSSIVATTERARESGALLPIATNEAYIDDSGIRFFVRILGGLRQKDEARKKQEAGSTAGKSANPFLPPETELTVGEITKTHLAVLNKFNVVEHHLLVVTRQFEDQEMLLTPDDFEAVWICMTEYRSLGFYNGGREAGASQQHKHLQLVPLPLSAESSDVPIGPLLPPAGPVNSPRSLSSLPFLNSFLRLGIAPGTAVRDTAVQLFRLYSRMLRQVGMEAPADAGPTRQSMPYCLLMTRDWMLLVPRSREFFENISFNSLAFAGSLFVRDEEQLERLRSFGPMNALRSVAVEKR